MSSVFQQLIKHNTMFIKLKLVLRVVLNGITGLQGNHKKNCHLQRDIHKEAWDRSHLLC